jgi:hypothetical protein
MLVARVNLARLQRASKGACESATGGGDDIVEGCRVRLSDFRADAVMFGDGAVDAEMHRFRFGREIGQT